MSPISPSTRIAELIVLRVSTASLVWRTFCSNGSAERIEDDGIKPGPGRFYGLRQGMGMIRVKKDWAVAFLPQTPHQSRNLPDSEKLPFALGRTDHHRDLQFLPGCRHRLQ